MTYTKKEIYNRICNMQMDAEERNTMRSMKLDACDTFGNNERLYIIVDKDGTSYVEVDNYNFSIWSEFDDIKQDVFGDCFYFEYKGKTVCKLFIEDIHTITEE